MWIFTKDGFYSTVKNAYCKRDEVVIRSRQKVDLERFLKKMKIKARIEEYPEADYLYRVQVPHTVWIEYITKTATELDYPNFKRMISESGDDERHHVYGECWFALRKWQADHAKEDDLYWPPLRRKRALHANTKS